MDIARAFTYVTEDENWQNKTVITLVIGVIPLINLAAIGWMLDLINNMLDGQQKPMPDWDDLSNQFVDRWSRGLMVAIAAVIYVIPLIVIAICLGILVAALDGGLLRVLISLVATAYVALMWLPLSIGMMRYARTRDFNHFLQFGRNISLAQEHLSTLIVLAVFVFIVGIVINILGNLPCIGWLISLAATGVSVIVVGHLTGQAAVEIADRKRGQA
ncbi:MAG: DUF4013 domain-containing protein [Anaerolineae bacterium]|nr:DUF4013 domain-containing protein [Anaerolineae bacterium]